MKMFEEVEDLTAANVLLQSQTRDVKWRQVVAEDKLDGALAGERARGEGLPAREGARDDNGAEF